MAASEGWFLNINTGKSIVVSDHATEVKEHPRTFGLTAKQIAKLDPQIPEQHDALRVLALKNGWIRVRSGRGLGSGVCIEAFWSPFDDVILAATAFLKRVGFGEYTNILFNDLKKRKTFEMSLRDLLGAEKSGEQVGFSVYDSKMRDFKSPKVEAAIALADATLAEPQDESARETVVRLLKENKE